MPLRLTRLTKSQRNRDLVLSCSDDTGNAAESLTHPIFVRHTVTWTCFAQLIMFPGNPRNTPFRAWLLLTGYSTLPEISGFREALTRLSLIYLLTFRCGAFSPPCSRNHAGSSRFTPSGARNSLHPTPGHRQYQSLQLHFSQSYQLSFSTHRHHLSLRYTGCSQWCRLSTIRSRCLPRPSLRRTSSRSPPLRPSSERYLQLVHFLRPKTSSSLPSRLCEPLPRELRSVGRLSLP